MEQKKARRTGFGALLGRIFWIVVIGTAGWRVYVRHGDCFISWWDSSRLDGVTILGRKAWGAARGSGTPSKMGAPNRITIHHLGGAAVADQERDQTAKSIKAIQTDHMRSRGWDDIGYHYIVDRNGCVWQGRPITQQGAHAGSAAANERNVGILLLGNFDLQQPGALQLASCGSLVEALRRKHEIPRDQVLSHKEVRCEGGLGPTNCPGKHLAAWVERYRRGEVAKGDRSIQLIEDIRNSPLLGVK